MYKLFCFFIPLIFILASCRGFSPRIVNDKDSVAYALAVNHAYEYRTIEPDMNPDAFMAGVRDALYNEVPPMGYSEVVEYVKRYNETVVPARNKKEADELIASVLANNKKARVTESGLVYEIIVEGTGRKPGEGDGMAEIMYTGTLPDGTVFERPEAPIIVNVNDVNVIAGLVEGVKLVNGGGKIKLWIPPNLAYGEEGDIGIKPNKALIFEIELLRVNPVIK